MTKTKPNYRGLSKDEIYLISRSDFEKQKLITKEYTKKLFGSSKKAANILDKLTRKDRLIQIERGKYIVVPIKAPNQLWVPNEYITAKLWMGDTPYYIGYFTMYNYWGFTEQVPQTMFVLNTKKSCTKTIGNVRYKAVRIDKRKYFGIKRVKIEEEFVCISDKERTLVDFIYNPIGSFGSVERVLKDNLNKIDIEKFIRYLIVFPVVSVRKRTGFFLEKLNYKKSSLKKLQKTIGNKTSYIILNPSNPSRRGKVNKDWRIIING